MDFKKVAGWAGIITVVLFVLNLILSGNPPAPEDGVGAMSDYLADNEGLHNLGFLFAVIVVIPITVFFAGFLIPFFRSDREHNEAFGVIIFAGFLVFGVGAGIGQAATGAMLLRGGGGLSDSTLQALWDLQAMGYGSALIAVTVFAGGVAVAVSRRGVMAAWVGRLSALVSLMGLLGLFTLLSDSNLGLLGYAGFLGVIVWTLAVSVNMVRELESVGS